MNSINSSTTGEVGHGVAAEPAELQGLLETRTPVQARKAVREPVLIADEGTAM